MINFEKEYEKMLNDVYGLGLNIRIFSHGDSSNFYIDGWNDICVVPNEDTIKINKNILNIENLLDVLKLKTGSDDLSEFAIVLEGIGRETGDYIVDRIGFERLENKQKEKDIKIYTDFYSNETFDYSKETFDKYADRCFMPLDLEVENIDYVIISNIPAISSYGWQIMRTEKSNMMYYIKLEDSDRLETLLHKYVVDYNMKVLYHKNKLIIKNDRMMQFKNGGVVRFGRL